ncbi:MAG: purine-binding chemotaxis protein CheW, partial [Leptospiraceae bacterium]|nr:purine-binding chemotaxis protein CheW [Leptospiraceae bacterium]
MSTSKEQQLQMHLAAAQANLGSGQQHVVFVIEKEEYCIDILQVQEIIRMTPVTWLPHRPPWIIGVLNLRGEIIPVIDLRIKFGLPKKEYTRFTRILIGQLSDKQVGVVVDAVNEVISLQSGQIDAAPGMVSHNRKTEYIKGIAKLEER